MATPPAATSPKSAASPPKSASPKTASPKSPRAAGSPGENDGVLLPGQHWSDERPLEDDDNDSALGDDAGSSTASLASSILHYRTVNGRTYHSERGNDSYWGANDERQVESLDIQYHAMTLAFDGKLYNAPLPEKIDKAVDIGTGTGIWAIDFGDERPETEVIGTDLSPIQPTWVPPNVRFIIDDLREPWLFEENSVDYVHTRWLIGSVADWDELFRQAFRVLKPGGWVESLECDGWFSSDDESIPVGSATEQYGYIFREGAKKLGLNVSFSIVADDLQRKGVEGAGFTNIDEKVVKVPYSEWPSDPNFRSVGQFARAALEADIEGIVGYMASGLEWSKEEITMYAMQLRRELRSKKIHGYYKSKAMWAQKPLNS